MTNDEQQLNYVIAYISPCTWKDLMKWMKGLQIASADYNVEPMGKFYICIKPIISFINHPKEPIYVI